MNYYECEDQRHLPLAKLLLQVRAIDPSPTVWEDSSRRDRENFLYLAKVAIEFLNDPH